MSEQKNSTPDKLEDAKRQPASLTVNYIYRYPADDRPLYFDTKSIEDLLQVNTRPSIEPQHAVYKFRDYSAVKDTEQIRQMVVDERVNSEFVDGPLPIKLFSSVASEDDAPVKISPDNPIIKAAKENRYEPQGIKIGPFIHPSDNTYVHRIDKSRVKERTGPNTVSSFIGGLILAGDQIDYSFKYLIKSVERLLTPSSSRRRSIDRELDKIAQEYAELPTATGMARVSSIGANIVGVGLPTVISGALGGPAAATFVGAGLTSLDVASVGAQADMEVRAYEAATGEDVSEKSRAAYVTSVMATNLILDVMVGSKAFKGVAPEVMGGIGSKIQHEIYTNPVAQKEFNAMTTQVVKNERKHIVKDVQKEAGKSFVEGGVMSGALEAERSIYTHEAPELSRIVDEAVTGAVWNMAQGVFAAGVQGVGQHRQRKNKDNLYYVSNDPSSADGLEISEIRNPRVVDDPDAGGTMVEGEIVSQGKYQGQTVRVPADNVVQGSYRRADADGATQPTDDHWDIPQERMAEYNNEWERAKSMMEENPDEAYALQNKVVQSIAADMGLPINVYAHLDDLPDAVLRSGNPGKAYAVTVNNDTPMIILDNCKDLSANNLKSIIAHEMVGHKGVRGTYDSQADYDSDIADAYYNIVVNDANIDKRLEAALKGGWFMPEHDNYNKWLHVAEEKSALMAETRDYVNPMHIPKGYEKMYRMLRRGEESLKNSTVNELRKSYYQGGNPMPSLYELEQE